MQRHVAIDRLYSLYSKIQATFTLSYPDCGNHYKLEADAVRLASMLPLGVSLVPSDLEKEIDTLEARVVEIEAVGIPWGIP